MQIIENIGARLITLPKTFSADGAPLALVPGASARYDFAAFAQRYPTTARGYTESYVDKKGALVSAAELRVRDAAQPAQGPNVVVEAPKAQRVKPSTAQSPRGAKGPRTDPYAEFSEADAITLAGAETSAEVLLEWSKVEDRTSVKNRIDQRVKELAAGA